MSENLNKIWANAKPLNDYFDWLISNNPIDESVIFERSSPGAEAGVETDTQLGQLASSAQLTAFYIELGRQKNERRSKLVEEVRNNMVMGQLRALGRMSIAGGLAQIVELTQDHWVGATINPEDNTVLIGGHTVDRVRIVSAESASKTRKPRRGPAPKSSFRREVVAACCTANPSLLGEPPSIRIRAYKRYIEKNYTEVDLRRGFSQSAFQEDELYLRENAGAIFHHLSGEIISLRPE